MNNLLINTNAEADTSIIILAVMLFAAGIAVILIAIFYCFYWLKHSWFSQKNRKRFTGQVFARKTMQYYGVANPQITSSWIWGSFKMWNYRRREKRLSLKPWTFNRKSRWTLNEAMENAYFATLIDKHDKRIWLYRFASRISGFLSAIAFCIGFWLIAPILNLTSGTQIADWELNIFTFIFIAFITFTSWIAVIWRIEILKKSKPFLDDALKKGDITTYEYTIIRRILKLRLWYATAEAIYHSIQLAIRIAIRNSNKLKR